MEGEEPKEGCCQTEAQGGKVAKGKSGLGLAWLGLAWLGLAGLYLDVALVRQGWAERMNVNGRERGM